jgi:uncharacterized protein (TIGR03435 family)
MRPDKDDIEKSLSRSFPSASTEQVESARARIYDRLRSDSAPLSVSPVKDAPSRPMPRFSRRLTPARIAACFVAVLLASAVFYRAVLWPDDLYAVVETTDGSVVQISQGRAVSANVGDKIGVGTTMRTGSGAEAKLKLPDGSRIEMQPESELSWQHADDGLHIQLKQGSVNVTPAEEAVGKLYVQNREQLVPVMGAIFQSAAAPIQSPATPKWEVVSVRPCENPRGGGGRGGGGGAEAGNGPANSTDPQLLVMRCVSMRTLVMAAYGGFYHLPEWSLANEDRYEFDTTYIIGPPQMNSERYTIEAKAEKPVGLQMMRGPMLQTILEDRFKLKLRRENRDIPLLELTVAKGGAKMQPHQEGSCVLLDVAGLDAAPPTSPEQIPQPPPGKVFCGAVNGEIGGWGTDFVSVPMPGIRPPSTPRRQAVDVKGLTVEQFIHRLMALVISSTKTPVVDKTGITGKFDFRVEYGFSPQGIKRQAQITGRLESDFDTSPTVFEALEDQVGLKLVETKGPWPHLVIDHVERPSPN